jgi:hypothetical protein
MPTPNPLNDFITYNALWTFACVTPQAASSSDYRGALTNVVFASAGRYAGERIGTAYGVPEYFIDNVEMRAIIAPTIKGGNATQIKMDFEIFEPFSLGLFLQSCQAAALAAGYKSYLDNAAYVLKLEFRGHTGPGTSAEMAPYYFLAKLVTTTFTASESGSKYKVSVIPYIHSAFHATVNTAFNEMKLVGKTAKEVLVDHPTNSLVLQLNDREAGLVADNKKGIPDKYTIDFVPADWGGPNPFEPIKGGDLEFLPESTGGTEVHKRHGDVDGGDGKIIRAKMTINSKEKSLMFNQGTSLVNIIDYVILSTKEARQNATDKGKMVDGFVTWWRISTDTKLLTFDERIKDFAREYIYRIVPYRIHHSVYMGPEAVSQGISKIKRSLAKEYFYIYTGKNTDVLKFEIDIKNAFYTAVDPNKLEDNSIQANTGVFAKVPPEAAKTEASEGQAAPSVSGNSPPVKPSMFAGMLPFKAGSGQLDAKQKIANEFYLNALTKTKDMINLHIELQGDPYWLPENGFGIYHPDGGGTPTAGKTMNYENLDIFVGVYFKTPIDARGSSSTYVFQDNGQDSPFSGIYKVVEVNHRWSGGHYKVTLTGPRMPAQDISDGGDLFPNKLSNVQKDRTMTAMKPGE